MIYCSIDIETTGLEPEKHQVLSIGCIIEDTNKKLSYEEIPKFYGVVLQHEIIGSPRALTMNKDIIDIIGKYVEGDDSEKIGLEQRHGNIFYKEDEIIPELFRFLIENGFGKKDCNYPKLTGNTKHVTINVAGKNFGTFDKLFLVKLPWFQKLIRVRQRILDPSILCVDWVNDETLPSLTECKLRLEISGIVTHNALEDAWDVIQVLRKNY